MTAVLAALLVLQAESAVPRHSSDAASPRKDPVPLYTNEDLDRVRPHRNETGVASVPAFAPPAHEKAARPKGSPRMRDEEYWRREAARVRERVDVLRAQVEELRATLAERETERRASVSRARRGDDSDLKLKARLAGLERRIRLYEEELQDRARRQGALPGWLR